MAHLVLISKQNETIVARVKQSGSFTIVDDAFQVGDSNRIVTYPEVCDLINSGSAETFGASNALELDFEKLRALATVDKSDLFEVTKAAAVYLLVSNINNVVLASGTKETVERVAAGFSMDAVKIALGVSWFEGEKAA